MEPCKCTSAIVCLCTCMAHSGRFEGVLMTVTLETVAEMRH
uniref:Uncharacterized protein n=1 Tax=Anopheles dirus TaxID=7168 RepID=A0A182NYK5_9DIPT